MSDEEAVVSVIGGGVARLEVLDPGFVRTRRGARAVGATVLAWATMVAVTYAFDVADPVRITLFGAGACFTGALLATDSRPRDRVRVLCWATVVSSVAIVVTVELSRTAAWLAAALLVLLMFASYALRSWSPRVAGLALMGAITVYVTGAGHITVGRIGWFVLALAVGFAWLAIWETLILPDDPLRSLHRSVQAFSRRAADTVATVVDTLNATRDGANTTHRSTKAPDQSLEMVRRCRTAIDSQVPGAVMRGLAKPDAENLRVALYSAERGLEEMINQAKDPRWLHTVPDEITWSITNTLYALAAALREDADAESTDDVARKAQILRGHVHDLTTAATAGEAPLPPETLLAAFTMIGAGELVAQSISQAKTLVTATPVPVGAAQPEKAVPASSLVGPDTPAPARTLSPTMALAIQAVVAAVAAGLIAKSVGNEQSLVVAWTAFVVIAGSAGASTRRAWMRLSATILGAVGGVLIAASVPDTLVWTIAAVAVGVFFTIFTAPVSYPAMVFWMSIALVPLFATHGLYFDLIRDKAVAALIGGLVAAVVALTVAPIRSSRDVRPALLRYLDALDAALASHLPDARGRWAETGTELDRAHATLNSTVALATTETHLFPRPGGPVSEGGVRVDAIHEAYLRLTPLLTDSSRRLHGWTDERIETGIRRLRNDVEDAKAAAGADRTPIDKGASIDDLHPQLSTASRDDTNLALADSLWRVENLHARLAELAQLLSGQPGLRVPTH